MKFCHFFTILTCINFIDTAVIWLVFGVQRRPCVRQDPHGWIYDSFDLFVLQIQMSHNTLQDMVAKQQKVTERVSKGRRPASHLC